MLATSYGDGNGGVCMRARVGTALMGVLAAAALLAACGSDEPAATATPAATAEPTPTAAPTATATPEATPPPRSGAVFTRYLRAQGLLRSGQYDQAIPQFDVVLRFFPDFAEAHHGRGLAYYNDDRRDFALADFDKAIELKPDYADAYRNRGVLYTNRGDLNLGIPDLRRALLLYEQDGDEEQAAKVRSLLAGILP